MDPVYATMTRDELKALYDAMCHLAETIEAAAERLDVDALPEWVEGMHNDLDEMFVALYPSPMTTEQGGTK